MPKCLHEWLNKLRLHWEYLNKMHFIEYWHLSAKMDCNIQFSFIRGFSLWRSQENAWSSCIFKSLIYELFHCFTVESFSWFFHDTLNSILSKTISLKCTVLCWSQYFRFKSVWRIICFWLFASSQFAPHSTNVQLVGILSNILVGRVTSAL